MTVAADAFSIEAPSLPRRLACFVYEGVLLFGVVMVAGLCYAIATQQRHALSGIHGLQLFIFVVLGAYFTWFWSHGGQTLAMQTWHIRLVANQNEPVSTRRALIRYVLSWLWFVPGLALVSATGLHGGAPTFVVLAAGVLAYASLTRLRQDRQYWHDAVCGTRLVTWRPAAGRAATR